MFILQGDAENYNLSECDTSKSDLIRSSIIPTSNYRNCVIHSGICKVIIEILFDLCNRLVFLLLTLLHQI